MESPQALDHSCPGAEMRLAYLPQRGAAQIHWCLAKAGEVPGPGWKEPETFEVSFLLNPSITALSSLMSLSIAHDEPKKGPPRTKQITQMEITDNTN